MADKKKLRRGKRHVIYEDTVNNSDDDDDTEQEMLRRQLQQLSDDELEALADIVRDEMDRYSSIPQLVTVPQYEIIEIPDEVIDDPVVEFYPRDRRSLPLDWTETEEPEYFAFPGEAMIDALKKKQDELELRDRIAEIAQILNERSTRGARFI